MIAPTGRIRTVLGMIGRIETAFAAAVLVGIVAMIVAQVALNAGLGDPLAWEQEAGAYALVWLTFVGASVALKRMRHVAIVGFAGRLPPRARALARALVFVLTLWTLCVLMRELVPIMRIEARATTVALPLDLPRAWFFSVPLMVASALMTLTVGLYLVEALVGAFGRPPRPDIPPVSEQS